MSATGAAQDYNPSTGALSRAVTMSSKCARRAGRLDPILSGGTPHAERDTCSDPARESTAVNCKDNWVRLPAVPTPLDHVETEQMTRAATDDTTMNRSGWSTPATSTPGSSGAPRRMKSSRQKSVKLSKAQAEAVVHDLTGAQPHGALPATRDAAVCVAVNDVYVQLCVLPYLQRECAHHATTPPCGPSSTGTSNCNHAPMLQGRRGPS